MANPFFQPGAARARRVRELFGVIARRYDLINDVQSLGWHRRWKKRLINMARVAPGEVALDLCCGTGDIAFGLERHGATALGLDFSAPMLAVARQRLEARRSGAGRCWFLLGDVLRIPLPDGAVDVVTIGYGLRNLADIAGGVREMWRVLRPGGRLLVLDFGKPRAALLRLFYFAYLRWCVPVFGLVFCGDASAYGYILESLRHYPGQEAVAEMLQERGAVNVQVVPLLGGAMSIHYAAKPFSRTNS